MADKLGARFALVSIIASCAISSIASANSQSSSIPITHIEKSQVSQAHIKKPTLTTSNDVAWLAKCATSLSRRPEVMAQEGEHKVNGSQKNKDNASLPYTDFLYSSRYCIHDYKVIAPSNGREMLSREQAQGIMSRYLTTFKALPNEADKVDFIDLFLQRLSFQFHITATVSEYAGKAPKHGHILLNIGEYTASKSLRGFSFSLVSDELSSEQDKLRLIELVNQRAKATSAPNLDHKILDRVNYVIWGTKVIHSKNHRSKSKANERRGEEFDEEEDTLDEDYRREDREYMEWAEEQAEGWGDDWDFDWEEEGDEKFIVLWNEKTSEYEHAYHFRPKGAYP